MKTSSVLFSTLGKRLSEFGFSDDSRRIIDVACAHNEWFSPAEVRRAVRALVDEMLQPDKLSAWLAAYPALPVTRSRRVLVVMAGNIPLVGFFDLLCTLASGHTCLVKPSSKDAVLMEYIIGMLHDIDPEVAVRLYDGTEVIDGLIATGSNNAVRYFKSRYADIPTLLRGSRQSVAVLAGNETSEQLRGLADDIWAYSGLGCRNVSLIFAPEGYKPALQMPDMNRKYINNYRQQKALLSMQGRTFSDLGQALLVEQQEFPGALSCIACSRYRSINEVEEWLRQHDEELQCVVSTCITHSRRVDFGHSQAPGLTDYPDDKDVMEWLTTI